MTSHGPSAAGHRPDALVRAALPLAVLSLLAILAMAASASIEFEEEGLRVNANEEGDQVALDLAVGPDDTLYAVWQDGRLVSAWNAGDAIFMAVSPPDSRGRGFDDEVRITPDMNDVEQQSPAVAVGSDGVIHVVWQQRDITAEGETPPPWDVYYSRSRNGTDWLDPPVKLNNPRGRNNTRPDVVAGPDDDTAYVVWEVGAFPRGTSISLALVDVGSRAWVREGLVPSTEDWEVNAGPRVAVDGGGSLLVSWSSMDLSGGGLTLRSQVFLMDVGVPSSTSALTEPVGLADDQRNFTHRDVALVVTKRHGAWVVWVRTGGAMLPASEMTVLSDRVLSGEPGEDLPVGTLPFSLQLRPSVAVAVGPDDGVHVSVSGVGVPTGPPFFSSVCDEHGCFPDPRPVVPDGGPDGLSTTVAADSLGNVYVGWDDGADVYLVQRENSRPGPPELTLPEGHVHSPRPTFEWAFNDPDAGSSQGAFELRYSPEPGMTVLESSGVVAGVQGRSPRYTAPRDLGEGRWYWTVRARDQLGRWSDWSSASTFLVDMTPPTASVVIEGDAEYVTRRVVELTVNASDNIEEEGAVAFYQVSNEPNFVNAASYEWPPPNMKVNHQLDEGEGVKVVFLRVIDSAGLSFTAMDSVIYNTTALFISHTPVATAPEDKDLNISCEVLRGRDVVVALHYRRADRTEFETLKMDRNGTTFWVVVPGDQVSTKGLEYFIEATLGEETVTSPLEEARDDPYLVDVYETTEEYVPPIYSPAVTLAGVVIVAVALFALWYFRIKERS